MIWKIIATILSVLKLMIWISSIVVLSKDKESKGISLLGILSIMDFVILLAVWS